MKLYIKHHFKYTNITCQLVRFYPIRFRIVFTNFNDEVIARNEKDKYTVGIWKLKK